MSMCVCVVHGVEKKFRILRYRPGSVRSEDLTSSGHGMGCGVSVLRRWNLAGAISTITSTARGPRRKKLYYYYYSPFRLSSDVRHTGRAYIYIYKRVCCRGARVCRLRPEQPVRAQKLRGSLFISRISRDLVYTRSARRSRRPDKHIRTNGRSFAPPRDDVSFRYFLSTHARPTTATERNEIYVH